MLGDGFWSWPRTQLKTWLLTCDYRETPAAFNPSYKNAFVNVYWKFQSSSAAPNSPAASLVLGCGSYACTLINHWPKAGFPAGLWVRGVGSARTSEVCKTRTLGCKCPQCADTPDLGQPGVTSFQSLPFPRRVCVLPLLLWFASNSHILPLCVPWNTRKRTSVVRVECKKRMVIVQCLQHGPVLSLPTPQAPHLQNLLLIDREHTESTTCDQQ